MKTIQELAKEADYPIADNRKMDWRNINKAIKAGYKIIIVPFGKIRTAKSGFKYHLAITFNGITHLFKCDTHYLHADAECFADSIINKIGKYRELYPDTIKVDNEKMCKCNKCKGKGILPRFLHYAKGVCFDCMGIGYVDNSKYKII